MESTPNVLRLSRLDQTVLRVYVRQLLIFPLSEPGLREDAQTVLAAGLTATLKQFPFLAGTVEVTDISAGTLDVQYPKRIDKETVSRIFTVNEQSLEALDYKILREAGFPPSRLPADILCPTALISHPGMDDQYAEVLTTFAKGKPIPVFAAQLNFIRGGLIISTHTHHSVVDGTGIAKIYSVWSGWTRSWNNKLIYPEQVHPAVLNSHRSVLDHLAADAKPMKLPEFRSPNDPGNAPMRNPPYRLSAKLLVFPAATIAELAASLSATTNVRISSFTALCALVWCQVTNARREAMIKSGIGKTTLGIAVDHRKRVGQVLPDDYLGNCANGMIISLQLSEIPAASNMNAEHIAPAALALSRNLGEVNLDWFRARLLELSKREISTKWILNLDTQNGPDIFITSWQHIGADDAWAIPGTTRASEETGWGCKPSAIRKPHNMWEGGMQILPRQKGDAAPFEIPLCLEEGEMERTLHGLRAGNWVQRVVEA
ncbi:hypothetical protein E8E13_001098 [Curvularia kusanoi]|uniref:Uncharacterized protein n=1 Tax=Curvularia kusanoi TaxID=90978 RepID=A0A9P4T318_CURKU|nr:hypothetical protein E8E13_001098 [Curvularia kusanoi]